MMSHMPADLEKIGHTMVDKDILRVGIIAEMDAVTLYEQMAVKAQDKNVKAALLGIAKEEKTHIGEFQRLLSGLSSRKLSWKREKRRLEKKWVNERRNFSVVSGVYPSESSPNSLTSGYEWIGEDGSNGWLQRKPWARIEERKILFSCSGLL